MEIGIFWGMMTSISTMVMQLPAVDLEILLLPTDALRRINTDGNRGAQDKVATYTPERVYTGSTYVYDLTGLH